MGCYEGWGFDLQQAPQINEGWYSLGGIIHWWIIGGSLIQRCALLYHGQVEHVRLISTRQLIKQQNNHLEMHEIHE